MSFYVTLWLGKKNLSCPTKKKEKKGEKFADYFLNSILTLQFYHCESLKLLCSSHL